MHEIVKESAPAATWRTLECFGGPSCGLRATIEAGETTLDRPGGRYVAVIVTRAGRTHEQLRWHED